MKNLDEKETWQAVLGEMELVFSKANYSTWFRDTFILKIEPEEITIGVPNNFSKEWLENKYHTQIFESIKKNHPEVIKVNYVVASPNSKPLPKVEAISTPSPVPNVRLETTIEKTENSGQFTLNPNYIFDNFIIGNSNRLAAATGQAIAGNPGNVYNPLFIYGGVGLGKTHLVHAIGNEIRARHPKKKIVYVSCEKFTNDFIASISSKKTDEFKKMYRDADVLMVDDIQFMSGKEGTQEEFFHTFNALHQANRQIILTSDRVPKAIPQIADRLSSRFGWGMVADIQPPNLEMRQAILQSKCKEKNCQFSDQIIDYIAQNIQSNIRELEGAINRIVSFATLNNTEPTFELAVKALSDIITRNEVNMTVDKVIELSCQFFNITTNDLLSAKRNKELVKPRQIVMYLLRHEMNLSYPKIGQQLNKKDHTTIIHGVEKIEKEVARDTDLHRQLTQLKEQLRSN